MASHIQKGKEGELLAATYLERKDYNILFSNWRYKRAEIDIIAEKDSMIHFIEVKTRHSLNFGYPEQAVSKKKFDTLVIGAVAFQNKYPFVKKIQFDVLSITVLKGKEIEFLLIEDVYF